MTDQTYFLSDKAIDSEDIIDGYRYGTTIIPYSSKYKHMKIYNTVLAKFLF